MIRILLILTALVGVVLVVAHMHSRHDSNLLMPTANLKSWQWRQDDGSSGGVAVEGDAVRCDILHLGVSDVDLQLYQTAMQVENGRTYRVRFSAKADKDWVIRIDSGLNRPGRNYSVGLKTLVPLSKQWQSYQYIFVGEQADGKRDRLPTFVLGQHLGSVWIKDVVVEEVK